MTQALCFRCGHVKFGALCLCAECGSWPTDSMEFDILFSDRYLSEATLRRFGDFVRTLRAAAPTADVSFWAFVRFVSERHTSIATSLPIELGTVVPDMAARTPDELKAPVAELLHRVAVPTIVVQHRRAALVSWQAPGRVKGLVQFVVGASGCAAWVVLAMQLGSGPAAKLTGVASLVPGAWGLAGLLECVTGRRFWEIASLWDDLKGWQRGALGALIVVVAFGIFLVLASLFL